MRERVREREGERESERERCLERKSERRLLCGVVGNVDVVVDPEPASALPKLLVGQFVALTR